MANFTIPYTTPANYTYNSDKIEIDSGLAKLKDLRPADATFYASYNTDINGNWGDGVLTGIATGGASVSGGKLDLAHNDVRCVEYDANLNADSQQQGCIRFKVTPNYSGNPGSNQYFVYISKVSHYRNGVTIYHSGSSLVVRIFDENDTLLLEISSSFSPTVGTEYEIELNYDITTGATRLFVDGNQVGTTNTSTGIRSSEIDKIYVGNHYAKTATSNFKIDDLIIFDTVQHTANYTSGESISETIYANDSPTIYKTAGDGVANIEEFIAFTETLGSGNEGSMRYQLSDDGSNWQYWNGSIWTTAGASDYNTASDCNAHMLDFDASADKIYVKAFLISNGNQQVEVDLNTIGYVINTSPTVFAGTDKTAIYNVAMSPFSDCLFSDAEGNIVKAEWKEEGGSYVEIPQGAYSTLLEAVQAFTNAFTHSEEKTVYLKVTDSYNASTEDTLTVDVNRVNITINIEDIDENDLSDVTFDLGDGTGSADKDSPFSHTAYIGSWTTTASKSHFDDLSESTVITTATTSLTFTMTRKIRVEEIKLHVDMPTKMVKGDSFAINCVARYYDSDVDLTGYKIRCDISDGSSASIKLATSNSGGADSQIKIINDSVGQFIILVAKDLTDNFNKNTTVEIEFENADGDVATVYKRRIKMLNENLEWTTP